MLKRNYVLNYLLFSIMKVYMFDHVKIMRDELMKQTYKVLKNYAVFSQWLSKISKGSM